jgi:hypothetical protein
MIRTLSQWAAKLYYIIKQEFQAEIADLHAGLSLNLAAEKRKLVEQLTREADEIEANIKNVDEKLTAGYWECEDGHENAECHPASPGEFPGCIQCNKAVKLVKADQMTGQEKYESDKERKEAQKIADDKRATAKAEEENIKNSEQTAKYFKDQATNNRTIADKIRTL